MFERATAGSDMRNNHPQTQLEAATRPRAFPMAKIKVQKDRPEAAYLVRCNGILQAQGRSFIATFQNG